MTRQTLVFANFLAPALFDTYQHIVTFIEQYTGVSIYFVNNPPVEELVSGHIDGGFICGLAYTRLQEHYPHLLELCAAPLLQGKRYQQKPYYFSDVVVRKESNFMSFRDLQHGRWAYNEKASHSGYIVVCYTLLMRGYSTAFFGQTMESGSHVRSLDMVLDNQADTAAIDSHLLDFTLHNNPALAARLRVIDMLGPSTIPPVVVAAHLDASLKQRTREALLTIHQAPFFAQKLHEGAITRFTSIEDTQYDDIRLMYRQVQQNFSS